MLFNSFEYFVFLGAVVVVYFSLPFRWRVWFLLGASYYFYMRWRWEFIFLIVAQTIVNYEAGRRIGASNNDAIRKAWLTTAILSSLGLLAFFKYFNFFSENFRLVFEAAGLNYMVPHLDILLPVGISFYTFQTLSYTIDVYRRDHAVENHVGRFALYVAFFPQLVAGPIERATNLLDQFKRENRLDLVRLSEGSKLILWGLFKKVVIADRLGIYVDRVYDNPELYSGSSLLLATYFFAFQIYCDFSGYSDIAIGSARILGYDLMQNFRLPYLASSISRFWKRWHISLTTWFASYVYVPLGGNRVSYGKWMFNVTLVFLVSGLWHGAAWTFVIWGALHAIYYFIESAYARIKTRWPEAFDGASVIRRVGAILLTFHAVLLGWIFFRAKSFSDAVLIIEKIVSQPVGDLYMGPSQLTTIISVGLVIMLIVVQILQSRGWVSLYFSKPKLPVWIRYPGYIALLIGIGLLGVSSNAFIYFQF